MKPYYSDSSVTLFAGDCLDVLRDLPDASVDSVVTDPPYALGFMGREWDTFGMDVGRGAQARSQRRGEVTPEGQGHSTSAGPYLASGVDSLRAAGMPFQRWCEAWAAECLRVLKPGGHLLAFGGTRTWHRLAAAVEDAGFEIRDSIAWLYGSGFPKSLDVSKAIDKAAPRFGMPAGFAAHYGERRRAKGLTHREVCEAGKFYAEHNKGGASVNWERGYNVPTPEQWEILSDLLDIPRDMWADLIDRVEAERIVTGRHLNGVTTGDAGLTTAGEGKERRDIPATPDAERWQGWGTALKPAFEPVVVARKPLAGTVAANVLAHGTGALNIDATRIGTESTKRTKKGGANDFPHEDDAWMPRDVEVGSDSGRWPANVILDDSQAAILDEQSGVLNSGTMRAGTQRQPRSGGEIYGADAREFAPADTYGDSGGASRFFYVAKADQSERPRVNGVAHPTVKPLDLMRWLVRLVTPPGGTVLEPFTGSGTTVEACLIEGFQCIAIEREADYLPLIEARIARRRDPVRAIQLAGEDLGLFDLGEVAG